MSCRLYHSGRLKGLLLSFISTSFHINSWQKYNQFVKYTSILKNFYVTKVIKKVNQKNQAESFYVTKNIRTFAQKLGTLPSICILYG